MIEINLLPHRAAKRVAVLRDSVGLLVLGLVIVAGGVWVVDGDVKQEIEKNMTSVRQLKANIEKFKPQQAEVVAFKAKKKQLQVKLDVIDSLDRGRRGPLRLMDEISARTPARLWLTKLTTQGTRVTLSGESLDTGVVADFLRSLNESRFFDNVDLVSTSRGKAIQGVKVVVFTVTAEMAAPIEAESQGEEAA
ncbi:MAG: PilN domain-containing protein [Myxococcota bacterium]|nr:PilN domain-containing protein [Myxococcota bacterium]